MKVWVLRGLPRGVAAGWEEQLETEGHASHKNGGELFFHDVMRDALEPKLKIHPKAL